MFNKWNPNMIFSDDWGNEEEHEVGWIEINFVCVVFAKQFSLKLFYGIL